MSERTPDGCDQKLLVEIDAPDAPDAPDTVTRRNFFDITNGF
ncbi:hypothetical protein [Microseira sp. BLCC-F43]